MDLKQENEMLHIALKEIMKRVTPTDPLNPGLDFEYTMAQGALKASEMAQGIRALEDGSAPDTAEEVESERDARAQMEAFQAEGEARYRESLQARMDL